VSTLLLLLLLPLLLIWLVMLPLLHLCAPCFFYVLLPPVAQLRLLLHTRTQLHK
jgi:hypothetical protein